MTYLFKNPIIKKLLELLIAVIDAKLFKAVEFIIFCTKGKQNIEFIIPKLYKVHRCYITCSS